VGRDRKGLRPLCHDEERTDHSTSDDAVGVFHLVTVGTWTLFLVEELTGVMRAPPSKFALFWILAIILITLCRVAARTYCGHGSHISKTPSSSAPATLGSSLAASCSKS